MKYNNYKAKNKWLISEINIILSQKKKAENRKVIEHGNNVLFLHFGKDHKSMVRMTSQCNNKELSYFLCGFIQALKE